LFSVPKKNIQLCSNTQQQALC